MHLKRVLSMALSMGMMAAVALPALAAGPYRDIQGHWAQGPIQTLTDKNILKGYEDGTYRPYRSVTRGEFIQGITRALGMTSQQAAAAFNDIPENYWAKGSIAKAASKDLIEGYPNSTFRAQKPLTRAEALTILGKVTKGTTPDEQKAAMILKNYRDGSQLPEWARTSIAKTIHYDIFKSTHKNSNWIQPHQPVTRGEMALMLNRLLDHYDIASRDAIEVYHRWEVLNPSQASRMTSDEMPTRTK